MNSLNRNITGIPVVLKSRYYMGDVTARTFMPLTRGGCLMESNTSAIQGYFMDKNKEDAIEGFEVERLATAEEIKSCTTLSRRMKGKVERNKRFNTRRK